MTPRLDHKTTVNMWDKCWLDMVGEGRTQLVLEIVQLESVGVTQFSQTLFQLWFQVQ